MSASLSGEKNGERKSSERLKLFLLSSVYFLIIAGYTVLRDLKNSVFVATVGKEYVPLAKFGVVLFLIPAILFYSKLVDRVRRYQLLMIYSVFYALFSLIVGLFLLGIQRLALRTLIRVLIDCLVGFFILLLKDLLLLLSVFFGLL